MTKYFKTINGDYISDIQISNFGQTEITESEYNHILDVVHNMPTAPMGYGYKLKTDLTWELYELPPMPPEEATDEDFAQLGREVLNDD